MIHREPTAVLTCDNVTKEYSKLSQTQALQGVSLRVRAGEYLMLFGPSGCGKSTLLNIMYGLESPSSGTVHFRGIDLYAAKPEMRADKHLRKTGYVFQQFSFFRSLTVLQNIYFPRLILGQGTRHQHEKKALELLDTVGLPREVASHYPQELSGGQQQRIALARALINNPRILFFDEPTGSLDKKSGDEVMRFVADLNHRLHRTIIMVTHNPDYLHYAHRVLFMEDGQIINEQVNRPLRHRRHHRHAETA